jgi:hypothetical protein
VGRSAHELAPRKTTSLRGVMWTGRAGKAHPADVPLTAAVELNHAPAAAARSSDLRVADLTIGDGTACHSLTLCMSGKSRS